MMFANHELKLLNASVIVYIIAGALIFHSLDEFADEPAPSLPDQHQNQHQLANGAQMNKQEAIGANSQSSNAVDNLAKQHKDNRFRRPARPFKADQLGQLRLSSVRRMWNITNQLNVLT